MIALRRLSLHHPTLALWLALAALTVKLLVPAGFMVGVVEGRTILQICSGFGPVAAAPMMHHAMADDGVTHAAGAGHGGTGHAEAEMPCPFAALAHGSLAATDPVLLSLALAFVLALGFAAVARPPVRRAAFLRPPLRGPPLLP